MDGFSEYLKDIVRYPLLNKEQEILLARQVQVWVTSENPTEREIKTGKRAYQKLINCNLNDPHGIGCIKLVDGKELL